MHALHPMGPVRGKAVHLKICISCGDTMTRQTIHCPGTTRPKSDL